MKSDKQLQQDVIAELNWDGAVEATRIGVEADGGIVTLSGHVGSYMEKWAAERVAKRVWGVKGLAVELDVILPGSSVRTDSDIARAAVSALEWSASVPKDTIKVLVEDGFITLSGEVDKACMRDAAVACVHGLVGVKGINNEIEMRIQPTSHDVKSKIESALQRRAHLDSKAITVAVQDDTITLSGVVGSWAERSIIERAAWNAPGVRRVVDKIVIA